MLIFAPRRRRTYGVRGRKKQARWRDRMPSPMRFEARHNERYIGPACGPGISRYVHLRGDVGNAILFAIDLLKPAHARTYMYTACATR
jgi:hypothetical protein